MLRSRALAEAILHVTAMIQPVKHDVVSSCCGLECLVLTVGLCCLQLTVHGSARQWQLNDGAQQWALNVCGTRRGRGRSGWASAGQAQQAAAKCQQPCQVTWPWLTHSCWAL